MSDLLSFERAAYARAPDRLVRMQEALTALTLGTFKEDASQPDRPVDSDAVLVRLAAATAAVVADPGFTLSPRQANDLFILGDTIARLFQATPFGNTDFLFLALFEPGGGLPFDRVAERLPFILLDSALAWPLSMFEQVDPSTAQQMLATLLSTNPVTTPVGAERRERLLEYASSIPDADFPRSPDNLVRIASAWMTCSYAGTPRKHDVKRLFNTTLRRMAHQWGFHDLPMPEKREIKARPTILVAAEIMNSGHVQYRYFGQYLRQLRTRFELVLLTASSEVDDAVTALFDRVLTFDRGSPGYLGSIFAMIRDTSPDIIFWPSVGMRHWGPLFANLRLAPIQLTALGHSASTFCDTIDYYLLEQGYVSDPALFGETVVTLPDESLRFERSPSYVPVAPEVRASPASLRIMIPSNLLKLNPGFVATLAAIRTRARRPVEFHFFPNATALERAAAARMIRTLLPGAHLHPRMAYPQYLAALSSGDLNLSPFPFGGLHSVIDSLRQGLPVVAMQCPEPHGRTDAILLRRLGMPEWLIAHDQAEYIETALRLIDDDALRIELSRQALALDIDRVMFGDATTPLGSEVVEAMAWIYRNHEAVRADGRKCWSTADRADFPGEE